MLFNKSYIVKKVSTGPGTILSGVYRWLKAMDFHAL